MKLTPLDIRHKEFKRGMRGYNDVEVDEFLDEVADEYERLFKENVDLRERSEALDDKVAGYRRIEETLQQTLVNAQASAEEQKRNATKQAQLILRDAEIKARQMVDEAHSERQAEERAMAKLKSAEDDFRFAFRQMLEGYLRQLGGAGSSADEEAEDDFARRAEAIKEAIAREAPGARAPAATVASPEMRQDVEAALAVREAPLEPVAPVDPPPEAEPVSPVEPLPSATEVRVAAPSDPAPDAREVETTMTQEPPPVVADTPPPDPAGEPPASMAGEAPAPGRERILFGESDDLLADVDTGVNENEFKW
jgi:cell division initiation protein